RRATRRRSACHTHARQRAHHADGRDRRPMRRFASLVGAGLLAPALLTAAWVPGSQAPAASQAASPDSDAAREAQSIKTVCGHCHNLELVLNTPRSYDAWHDTVQKMID